MRVQVLNVILMLFFVLSVVVLGELPQLHISYKPQKISPRSQGLVRQLLHEKIRDAYIHPQVLSLLASLY